MPACDILEVVFREGNDLGGLTVREPAFFPVSEASRLEFPTYHPTEHFFLNTGSGDPFVGGRQIFIVPVRSHEKPFLFKELKTEFTFVFLSFHEENIEKSKKFH